MCIRDRLQQCCQIDGPVNPSSVQPDVQEIVDTLANQWDDHGDAQVVDPELRPLLKNKRCWQLDFEVGGGPTDSVAGIYEEAPHPL